MSRIPVARLIGLIRYLDGSYRPSNEKSAAKLSSISERFGFSDMDFRFIQEDIAELKKLAAQQGYRIIVSNRGLL